MLQRHKQRRKNKAGEGNETDNRASGCYAINCRNYDGICIKWTLVWLNSQLIVCNWLHLACSTSQTVRERAKKCVRARLLTLIKTIYALIQFAFSLAAFVLPMHICPLHRRRLSLVCRRNQMVLYHLSAVHGG